MEFTKDSLLDIGIEKLRNFGFLHANKKNVFEDEVYKFYFKKIISSISGQSDDLDSAIKELFSSIDKKDK